MHTQVSTGFPPPFSLSSEWQADIFLLTQKKIWGQLLLLLILEVAAPVPSAPQWRESLQEEGRKHSLHATPLLSWDVVFMHGESWTVGGEAHKSCGMPPQSEQVAALIATEGGAL